MERAEIAPPIEVTGMCAWCAQAFRMLVDADNSCRIGYCSWQHRSEDQEAILLELFGCQTLSENGLQAAS